MRQEVDSSRRERKRSAARRRRSSRYGTFRPLSSDRGAARAAWGRTTGPTAKGPSSLRSLGPASDRANGDSVAPLQRSARSPHPAPPVTAPNPPSPNESAQLNRPRARKSNGVNSRRMRTSRDCFSSVGGVDETAGGRQCRWLVRNGHERPIRTRG